MGKNTDKLYVTHSEHASGGSHSAASSGHIKKQEKKFASLPFDHCALTLKPFELPVANSQGIVYDLLAIIPYLKKHGVDPVTGEKLASGDLIKLNFAKNSNGEYHDPLTFKVFTNHTPIVAIKTSGNVFSKESVDRLNVKANFWQDLVSDEPFAKQDIITLQDPHNPERRELRTFKHLSTEAEVPEQDPEGLNGINLGATGNTSALLKTIHQQAKVQPSEPVASTSKAVSPSKSVATTAAGKGEPWNASRLTTGHLAASLTSTAAPVFTKTERALWDEEELMYETIERERAKGYVKFKTNWGEINLELFCDKAPRACYNFLTLAKDRKYDGTVFHRLIPGFMMQGGDPTGTGTGGESIWQKPFADEFDNPGAMKHTKRGILSMANSGPNSNGSQFFLTFRECSHLNGKHTVFGQIVGSMDVLDKVERIPITPTSNRPLKPIKLIDVGVFKNPFDEYREKLEKRLEKEAKGRDSAAAKEKERLDREKDRMTWTGRDLTKSKADGVSTEGQGSVGKYLGAIKRPAISEPVTVEVPNNKKRKTGGFASFDSW